MTDFRMKIENKPGLSAEVDLRSFGETAKAWSDLVTRTAKLLFEWHVGGTPEKVPDDAPNITDLHLRVTNVIVDSLDITSIPVVQIDDEDSTELPPNFWESVYSYLHNGFVQLEAGNLPETIFPSELRQPARELVSSFGENGIGRIQFGINGSLDSELTWEKAGQLAKSVVKEHSYGSVDGVITSISLSRRPQFGLRPAQGNVINCHFDQSRLLDDVTGNLLKKVMVIGRIVRDSDGRLLSVSQARTIVSLPDDSTFQPLEELFGSFEDITGELSTTQWIEAQRGK